MRYQWIDEYLLNKRSVTKDLQSDWNWIRYHIGGKMFAAVCLDSDDKPYYITLKLEPEEGNFLRQQFEDILPGYYMNKQHWNSVKPDGEVPDDLLKDLLDKSYHLVLKSFSGKKQREILGLSCCGSDCSACSCFGSMCQGCNAANGKVFHAPEKRPVRSTVAAFKRINTQTAPPATASPALSGETQKIPAFRMSSLRQRYRNVCVIWQNDSLYLQEIHSVSC